MDSNNNLPLTDYIISELKDIKMTENDIENVYDILKGIFKKIKTPESS
ncbi:MULTISPECIES: hypothetical protein [Clostridium]|nr:MULTISPECIES: hypothetical protein [Clostridium]MBW9159353.1 hypothetical protein [Clostridium tagluense]MBZ9637537.1 hypothetical protein [Clostridium sp. FP1]MCB2300926.1 hypothetical protein [Clostridium tagluense]WLC68072.1 hypothetical protein KTC93_24155 [Clostridium tagluense]